MSRSRSRWLWTTPYLLGLFVVPMVLFSDSPLAPQRRSGGCGTTGQAGVAVDGQGVLRMVIANDPTHALTRQRIEAAKSTLPADLARRSTQRKISLTRLEKALAARIAAGQGPTEEMKYLAGLSRVQNVFFYPESGDIVIAGPAEGYVEDITGRVVGLQTARPVVELQDLVTALRAFAPNTQGTRMIGCSIDATQEGLAAMQQFLGTVSGVDPRTEGFEQHVTEGLRQSLGLQKVTINGVSPKTHFAQVLVEADYRMKLIGIGLETPPVKISSYVDLADPATVSRNAMQRWWFVPDYNCVRVSDDAQAMELVGAGVKLMGEDELVASDGSRNVMGGSSRASTVFTTGFTQKYPQLADKHPVYAQLRNLIDLVVAAAFIQEQDYYSLGHWDGGALLSEEQLPVETYQAPTEVDTAVASKWKGHRLMTPVGGGVTIQAKDALKLANLLSDDDAKVAKAREQIDLSTLAEGQWWWD